MAREIYERKLESGDTLVVRQDPNGGAIEIFIYVEDKYVLSETLNPEDATAMAVAISNATFPFLKTGRKS